MRTAWLEELMKEFQYEPVNLKSPACSSLASKPELRDRAEINCFFRNHLKSIRWIQEIQ